jgi:predicted DNA-binding protein
MRSVRFDDDLEARLQQASQIAGKPASAIIREAVRTECDRLLNRRADLALADVIGSVAGRRSNSSAKTGRAYLESLKRRQGKRK